MNKIVSNDIIIFYQAIPMEYELWPELDIQRNYSVF